MIPSCSPYFAFFLFLPAFFPYGFWQMEFVLLVASLVSRHNMIKYVCWRKIFVAKTAAALKIDGKLITRDTYLKRGKVVAFVHKENAFHHFNFKFVDKNCFAVREHHWDAGDCYNEPGDADGPAREGWDKVSSYFSFLKSPRQATSVLSRSFY